MTEPVQKPAPGAAHRMFAAVLENPARRRWPVLAVLLAIATTYFAFRLVTSSNGTNVITPLGMRTVRVGMTNNEVNHLLGRPIALVEAESGEDCYRYGYPNLEASSFVVYSLCYEQMKLRSISESRYTAWAVSPDGRLIAEGGDPNAPKDLGAVTDPAALGSPMGTAAQPSIQPAAPANAPVNGAPAAASVPAVSSPSAPSGSGSPTAPGSAQSAPSSQSAPGAPSTTTP